MEIDEFLQLVKKRRSIRRYKPDPVPEKYLEIILEAARWAMSGANAQPWEFIVLKDRATKEKLAEIRMEDARLVDSYENIMVDELRHQGFGQRQDPGYKPPFLVAPVIIVICGDARTAAASAIGPTILGVPYVLWQNLANANQMIQLAAAACGLGSSWGTVNWTFEGRIKDLLGVPDVYRIYAMVPIGYPDYEPLPPYRKELSEMVHYERYDISKFKSHQDLVAWLVEHRKRMKSVYPR